MTESDLDNVKFKINFVVTHESAVQTVQQLLGENRCVLFPSFKLSNSPSILTVIKSTSNEPDLFLNFAKSICEHFKFPYFIPIFPCVLNKCMEVHRDSGATRK